MRAEKLLAEVRGAADPDHPDVRKSLAKLASLGPAVAPLVIAQLGTTEKKATVALVELLANMVDARTLPVFARGLSDPNPRVVAGTSWALSSARNFPATALLDLLQDTEVSKPALLDVIAAHRTRFQARDLLQAAYAQDGTEKATLFKILGDTVDDSAVPDLIARIEGKDPIARMHIINLLSRFNLPQVRQALQNQLRDPNRMVRQAALVALSRMDGPIDVAIVARLLRDADMEVQNKAVEVLIRARDPEVIKHLVDVLKDENEYARRSAVEVLNEVGDARSVKYLLDAIKDADWWVRSRAADALGKIGGPRVLDAVLQLVRDKDDDLRRAAIEILNQTKDERAVNSLIEATRDNDWWVSERAVDALAEIGSKRAVPRLLEMLQGPARSVPTALRALGKLGDARVLEQVVAQLARPEPGIRVEALAAAAKLTDDRHADTIRQAVRKHAAASPDPTVQQAAIRALEDLDVRFSASVVMANEQARKFAEPAHTLLAEIPAGTFTGTGPTSPSLPPPVVAQETQLLPEATPKLDIGTLKPGDVIEGRYKFIDKIGKGAFGTVLLMEDTVVDERLILKFLNPNVAGDEEMMQRFVHELRYSRKITHRNVIRIYDFLYMQGLYAISMEYFPSHTLGAEIKDEKPMPLARALQFAIDIATGMTVAHQVGIVHRDLKPANVLINVEGLLKIVDFGVAAAQREGDTQLTKTGYVIGSPKYMAPEQILGKKVDPRADVYSLGVIMYEMFTGVPPYSRGDHMSVMYQHVQGKARQPQEINPHLPPGLSDLVMKAMSVDKTKRFQSMEELKAAIEPFLKG